MIDIRSEERLIRTTYLWSGADGVEGQRNLAWRSGPLT